MSQASDSGFTATRPGNWTPVKIFLGEGEADSAAPPVPPVEMREVAPVPRLAQLRRAQVPIRRDLTRRCTQILPKIVDRRPTPVPVAVIDAVNDQSPLEHECVRDHRIVFG